MPDRLRAAISTAVLAIAALLALQDDALAHKLNVYAVAAGRSIRGEAYFSGGGRPKNIEVVVLGPGGEELGRTRTDDKGVFRFLATRRCDHTFVVETADGHRAEHTVEADKLPNDLPAPPAAASRPAAAPSTAAAPAATSPTTSPTTQEAIDKTLYALVGVFAQAVRKELKASEDRTRIRDVIGGIGYIFGAVGLLTMWKYRGKRGPKQPRT
jgi:nickel transport protein